MCKQLLSFRTRIRIQADKELQIIWQDDHVSKFDWDWLCERSFSAENRKNYIEHHYRTKPKLWSKNQFVMKEFQANSVFDTDEGTYRYQRQFHGSIAEIILIILIYYDV